MLISLALDKAACGLKRPTLTFKKFTAIYVQFINIETNITVDLRLDIYYSIILYLKIYLNLKSYSKKTKYIFLFQILILHSKNIMLRINFLFKNVWAIQCKKLARVAKSYENLNNKKNLSQRELKFQPRK